MALAQAHMNWLQTLLKSSQTSTAKSGGLILPGNKPALNGHSEIDTLCLPSELVFPLLNYRKQVLQPLVITGQRVTRGEPLAEGLIATASGTIKAIENRPIAHPSQRSELCVVLQVNPIQPDQGPTHTILPVLTLERLRDCAVQGLGGAGFFTADKLKASGYESRPLELLIINAVECEPIISCDEALLITDAQKIIQAVYELIQMTHCDRCVIAIENDKTAALGSLKQALVDEPGPNLARAAGDAAQPGQQRRVLPPIELIELEPVYPSGAERLLIERICEHPLPETDHPARHSIVCINVATALAAWRAQLGEPMCSRVVTVAGRHSTRPVNARVALGTSVADVLRMTGNDTALDRSRVRVGGPLSGFDLHTLEVPVTATTNCITVEPPAADMRQDPCIRCGACSDACPVELLPQQLYWYTHNDKGDDARRFGLDSCIECACCDLVCPSNIPLTATFRYAKGVATDKLRASRQAAEAELRFQQREQRLDTKARQRKARREAAKAKLESNQDPIADALARVRERRRKP